MPIENPTDARAASTPDPEDDRYDDIMRPHRVPGGLPKFVMDWSAQDLEAWFGRKEKELERHWNAQGQSRHFIEAAHREIPDRHRRLIRLIGSPDFRTVLLSGCAQAGDATSPEQIALARYAARFGVDTRKAPLPQNAPWYPLVAWTERMDDLMHPGIARPLVRCLGDAGSRLATFDTLEPDAQRDVLMLLWASLVVLRTRVVFAWFWHAHSAVREAFDWTAERIGQARDADIAERAAEIALYRMRDAAYGLSFQARGDVDGIKPKAVVAMPSSDAVLRFDRLQRGGAILRDLIDRAMPAILTAARRQIGGACDRLAQAATRAEAPRTVERAAALRKEWLDALDSACTRAAAIRGLPRCLAEIERVAGRLQEQADAIGSLRARIQSLAADPVKNALAIGEAGARIEQERQAPGVELDADAVRAPSPEPATDPPSASSAATRADPVPDPDAAARVAELTQSLDAEREKLRAAGTRIAELTRRAQEADGLERERDGERERMDRLLDALGEHVTPEMALRVAQAVCPRLDVLPEAWESARDARVFRRGGKLLSLLLTLGGEYADALAAGTPDAQARAPLGAAYRARESDLVNGNRELRQARTFGGIYMEAHLAIGNDNDLQKTLRVHFAWREGRIVIGWCGAHRPLLGVT